MPPNVSHFSARRSDHNHAVTLELHWSQGPGAVSARCAGLPMPAQHCTGIPRRVATTAWSVISMSLVVPATRCSTLGYRAFPVSATRTWKTVPSAVRAASSLASFRQTLKNTFREIISGFRTLD